jgi:hypothetical protein
MRQPLGVLGRLTAPGQPLSRRLEKQFLLWLVLVVAIPVLVAIANLLTGRDPALLLRAGLARAIAPRDFATATSGQIVSFKRLRGRHYRIAEIAASGGLAAQIGPACAGCRNRALPLLLLALKRAGWNVEGDRLAPVAQFCRRRHRRSRMAPVPLQCQELSLPGAIQPLGIQTRPLRAIREPPAAVHSVTEQPRRLLVPDAFRNPETPTFALKVTLAVMRAYFAEDMLEWLGIHRS